METVYKRRVNYYETDRMGIVHHANYIKYFEEARIHLLDCIGLSYSKLEEMGIIMPVLNVECNYRNSSGFDDELEVRTVLSKVGAVKVFFSYEIYNSKTGDLVCTGASSNGFLNSDFKPLNIKKAFPQVFERLSGE